MKRITCVYTGFGGLSDIVEKIFLDACGDVCFHHIADSGLIEDILSEGGVTPLLEKRLFALFDAAATTQPDIIVSTCSSIGETTRKYAAMHPELRPVDLCAGHEDGTRLLRRRDFLCAYCAC